MGIHLKSSEFVKNTYQPAEIPKLTAYCSFTRPFESRNLGRFLACPETYAAILMFVLIRNVCIKNTLLK